MKDRQEKEALLAVIELIKQNKMENQICMSSFLPKYLEEIKNLEFEIEYGFLVWGFGKDPDDYHYRNIRPLNKENYPNLDFAHRGTVNLHFSHCNKENLEFVRKNKLGVHSWFSKNPKHYKDEIVTEDENAFKKLLELGVDVICTNYPDVAIRVREEFMESERKRFGNI